MTTQGFFNGPSPALIYDLERVNAAVAAIRTAFRQVDFTLSFAVKANRHPRLLARLARDGLAASVSSVPEFHAATSAGFKQLFATGPAFSADELSLFTTHGTALDLSSLSQVDTYGRLAGPRAIGLRLRLPSPPDWIDDDYPGPTSRFGIDPDDAALTQLLRRHNLDVQRLMVHVGDVTTIDEAMHSLRSCLDLAAVMPRVTAINLGGGWYPLYRDGAALAEFGRRCAPCLSAWQEAQGRRIGLICEPGTSIVKDAGWLVTTVLAVDRHRHHNIVQVVVDSSAWNLMPWPAGAIVAAHPERSGDGAPIQIVGNTCYERDILVRTQHYPCPEVGDRLLLDRMGAYVASAARTMHGIAPPPEFFFDAVTASDHVDN